MKHPIYKRLCLLFLFLHSMAIAQTNTLMNSSAIKTVALRLKPSQDLKMALDSYVKENKIKAACIITCVGSLQQVIIRYADKKEIDTLNGKFEIVSLTGTLADSGSHLHIAVSNSNGQTIGGHLKEGSLVYTTAEIVIGVLTDVQFEREIDSTYGYKELVIKPIGEK